MPTVAVVLPFDPKMTPKNEVEATLKRALTAAEKDLLAKHSADEAMPVIKKLRQATRSLNFSTHKKSLALFVTAAHSKTTYLDFKVEEQVIVDRPFRVRDLADCKPSSREYLLLLLSSRESTMYIKGSSGLRLIKSNTPQNAYAYLNEVPERSGSFSDREARHEVMLNKFLHHMDVGLGAVLKVYPLPVFIAAPERVAGHFARITRHTRHIAGYIHKQVIGESAAELEKMLQPQLADWSRLREQLLALQLEKAAEAGKLVCGLEAVGKAAACSNSRLVVIEKNAAPDVIGEPNCFYSDGPIDQIVEKVLENGGDLEKADGTTLAKYGPIALIRYY